jgi:predicted ATPase/class 3 adenylate cyclase
VDLPTGTVTLVFTDIEGSTALAERLAESWPAVLAAHHRLLRETFAAHRGVVFGTEGDAFFVVFRDAGDAVAAAAAAQRSLTSHGWPDGAEVRVRVGVHTGTPTATPDGYVGLDLHRAARVAAAAHGGQVLVSDTTRALLPDALDGLTFRDLGEHRLKDLTRPQRLHQLCGPGLRDTFPRLRTLEGRRMNLPALPTPLVGREAELETVRRLLRDDGVRLVTLTGPGGTGKTRLALQAAADLVDEFDDGTFFVELAMAMDADVVLPEIARVLGVEEAMPTPLGETLKAELDRQKLLLLLDNFEHVAGASGAVFDLVTACPGLKLLVTSREPLHLPGEHQYPVPPLLDLDAARLFVERARAIRPDLDLTSANVDAIEEICRRLDGLPLAIELAAGWSKVLSPPALVERLDRGLELAARPGAPLPERQATLRNTIAWSYDLLPESERRLHARLSVFAGGFTLDAAERVCTPDELGLDPLEGLAALVDRSLLQQMDDPRGEPRFSMLETIREYAREQLADDGPELVRRHALEFARFAEEADGGVRGSDQLVWLERLETEHDNLRTALEGALELGDAETALRLGGALGWFWYAHGHALDGCRRLTELLAATADAPDHLRAPAMYRLGVLRDVRGETEAAAALLEQSLGVFREHGDTVRMADALNSLGVIELGRGNLDRARALLEESIAARRALGDEARTASALSNLGLVAFRQGDVAMAEQQFAECLALDRAHGNEWGVAADLANLATVTLEQGEPERARALVRETLETVRQVGDKELVAIALEIAAALAAADGDAERAGRLEGTADALRERIGAPRPAFDAEWLERHLVTVAGPLLDGGRSAGRLLDEEQALEEAADAVERHGRERASSPDL